MFRRQKRFASGSQQTPRRALALMRVGLLGGWLFIAALTCVVALSLETDQASAASTAAQSCVGSTNGTPVATPPVEEPSATVGSTDTNQTPCATITPTVNGGASSLPGGPGGIGNGPGQNGNLPFGGINGTQNSSGPNGPDGPTGSSNTANPTNTNSPNSQGANVCSGPLCWVQNALSSAGSAISHAWNSASTLEKVLIVVGAVVVVVVAVVVVIAALPEEAVAGIVGAGAAIVGFVGDVATFFAAHTVLAALTAGAINAIGSMINDIWINPTSPHDVITHAIFYFVSNALFYGAISWVGKGLTLLGAMPWVEDTVTSVFGKTMGQRLLDFIGVHALWGAAIKRGTTYLAKLVTGLLAIGATSGLEILGAHQWGLASPLPQPTWLEPGIAIGLWILYTLPAVGPAFRSAGPEVRGVLSEGSKQTIVQLWLEKLFGPGSTSSAHAPSAQRAHSTSSASSSSRSRSE